VKYWGTNCLQPIGPTSHARHVNGLGYSEQVDAGRGYMITATVVQQSPSSPTPWASSSGGSGPPVRV
jgi:hypothetical protein